jgi:16S rRNA (guanine966-N2)-methyltransferase
LRIISGKYKSRKVYSPPGSEKNCVRENYSGFRPTTDRARETLFNVLNNIIDFENIICLDLFAGTGALGFEAISRGAASTDFVEASQKQTAMIKKTAEELGCGDNIKIYNEDALKFIEFNSGAPYDLIFADPPYAYEHYDKLINVVKGLEFSIFVLEHGAESQVTAGIEGYDVTDKKIGAVNFKIFVSKQ